jgi:hypothetical protein
MDFLQLDAGSLCAANILVPHYVRDGKLAQAKEVLQKFADQPRSQLMLGCLQNPPSADLPSLARKEADIRLADRDPEPRYVIAGEVLFCGQKDLAVQLVRSAIAGHYCAYAGLQNDSVWTKLRGTPEFAELLFSAKQCQTDFLTQRSQVAAH